MIGNEVPHNAPASMVKKTALVLVVNSGLRGNGWSPAWFLDRQCQVNKTFLPKRKSFKIKKDEVWSNKLFHYCFEVFVGCFQGHDVEFVNEHFEDVGCDEGW